LGPPTARALPNRARRAPRPRASRRSS
jgi:hypothetical protein